MLGTESALPHLDRALEPIARLIEPVALARPHGELDAGMAAARRRPMHEHFEGRAHSFHFC